MQTLHTNQPKKHYNQKLQSQGAKPKEFLRGSERCSRETGDRNRNYDLLFLQAIPEKALIIDEPIMTVERDCQHQEAKTEAEVGRTRVVRSS